LTPAHLWEAGKTITTRNIINMNEAKKIYWGFGALWAVMLLMWVFMAASLTDMSRELAVMKAIVDIQQEAIQTQRK